MSSSSVDHRTGFPKAEPVGSTVGRREPAMDSATRLAEWARTYSPTDEDRALALLSLRDTVACVLAARDHGLTDLVCDASDAARWASQAHVLSFDDLHMPSTAHISAVCVSAVLSVGGEAEDYLGAAGIMARLGGALGWEHYARGWHATCTAGAPAAAAGAALALGLSSQQIAEAMALALPAAGGVRRAFGTVSKPLQVGFAAEAGVRAAKLVAKGAKADPSALDQWLELVGGDPSRITLPGPAVPGGLAVKLIPCCYSLQRPIAAVRGILAGGPIDSPITRISVTTPESSAGPLIRHRPRTGLESTLSLEYAIAATLLDGFPGFDSFTTEAVTRQSAVDLMDCTRVTLLPGGGGLLAGEVLVEIELENGERRWERIDLPPGAPGRSPTETELKSKWMSCGRDVPSLLADLDWDSATAFSAAELSRLYSRSR